MLCVRTAAYPLIFVFRPIYEVFMGKENYALRRVFSVFGHRNKREIEPAQPDGLADECHTAILGLQVQFPAPTPSVFF